jgi:hypothetical protein
LLASSCAARTASAACCALLANAGLLEP